jgi:hypothetical protein
LFNLQQNNFYSNYIDNYFHTTLELNNVEIRNVYYGMNSMINMTELGGQINITNSKFTHINICGSIIKNNYTHFHNANLSLISDQIISNTTKRLLGIMQDDSRELKTYFRDYTELFTYKPDEP